MRARPFGKLLRLSCSTIERRFGLYEEYSKECYPSGVAGVCLSTYNSRVESPASLRSPVRATYGTGSDMPPFSSRHDVRAKYLWRTDSLFDSRMNFSTVDTSEP